LSLAIDLQHPTTAITQREPRERDRPEMWTPPFLYPPPASVYVTAMSAVSLVTLANAGLSELRGQHMAYSKFWHVVAAAGGGTGQQRGTGGGALLPSRVGMLVAYAPALVAAAASFAVPGAVEGARAQLLAAALAAHFLKRVLEVTAKTLFSNPSIIRRRVRPNFLEFFVKPVTTTHLQSKFRAVQQRA
jgi:hypothetical protein